MYLHQPYHRHILSKKALIDLGSDVGLMVAHSHNRWYYDSLMPGCNARFISQYAYKVGSLDAALGEPQIGLVLRSLSLMVSFFFGKFLEDPNFCVFFINARRR